MSSIAVSESLDLGRIEPARILNTNQNARGLQVRRYEQIHYGQGLFHRLQLLGLGERKIFAGGTDDGIIPE